MDVLFIKQGDAGFIKKDEVIIHGAAQAKSVSVYRLNRLLRAVTILGIGFLLVFRIWRPKVVVIHFANWIAGYFSWLSDIGNYKVIVFICGVDVTVNPLIGHGIHLRQGWTKKLSTFALSRADWLLPKAQGLVAHENSFSGEVWQEGILTWAPKTKATIQVVYNGYDTQYWVPDASVVNEKLILCVGYAKNREKALRKGIDVYLEVARRVAHIKFVLIGPTPAAIAKAGFSLPANVKVLPPQPKEELRKWYQRASIFCLFSRNEGMPNVLSEAMLCGCYPMTSNVNGIPEVTGGLGDIFSSPDADKIAQCIKSQILVPKKEYAHIMHQHIAENFSLEVREKEIAKILNIALRDEGTI